MYLPDITNFNKLTIESVVLESGNFEYLRLYDSSGNILKSFSLSNSKQEFDLSSYSGTGYSLLGYAWGVAQYKSLIVSNITLSNE